jgi:hypothetical protein
VAPLKENAANIPSKGLLKVSTQPCLISITTPGTAKLFKNLKVDNATGLDAVSAKILKETSKIIFSSYFHNTLQ